MNYNTSVELITVPLVFIYNVLAWDIFTALSVTGTVIAPYAKEKIENYRDVSILKLPLATESYEVSENKLFRRRRNLNITSSPTTALGIGDAGRHVSLLKLFPAQTIPFDYRARIAVQKYIVGCIRKAI